jgi:hypothetical protein
MVGERCDGGKIGVLPPFLVNGERLSRNDLWCLGQAGGGVRRVRVDTRWLVCS